MRSRALAMGDLLAIDTCSTLGMLAAVGARQLAPAVTQAATNAVMAALSAPGRVPLLPTDHAAMLAGMTAEWAGATTPADALDAGSVENARAALDDLQVLLALGMQERGYEYAVPAEFFARPLWPAPGPDLRTELAKWESVLASFNLLEFSERFRKVSAGLVDWLDAQRRAEAWVRMAVPSEGAAIAPPVPTPPAPGAGAAGEAVFAPQPIAYPSASPRVSPPVLPLPAPFAPTRPPVSPAPSRRTVSSDSGRDSGRDSGPAWKAPLPRTAGGVRPASPAPGSADPARPTFHVPAPRRNAIGFADLEPYANALASFIDSLDPRTPFNLAIEGPAGSGRSVIGSMLRRRLLGKPSCRSDGPHLTMWFDANQLRPSPTLTTSLMRDLAVALDRERPPRQRHLHRLARSLQGPADRWKYTLIVIGLVLTILGLTGAAGLMVRGIPPDLVAMRQDMLQILTMAGLGQGLPAVIGFAVLAVLFSLVELYGFLAPFCKTLARYLHEPHTEDKDAAYHQLGQLLHDAVPPGCRMVVFVEDLESAGVLRVQEFLESLNTTLRFPELVFVLLTDPQALRQQAEEHRDSTGAQLKRIASLAGVVDLQVDLPARQAGPQGSAGGRSTAHHRPSAGHARGLAAFWGPWSRDWRADRGVREVLQRTMYVDPPYLAPLVMVFWVFYWLPVAAFIRVQEWVYPQRRVRTFTAAKTGLWHVLLTLAILGHGVLAFQTLDGLLTNMHYVIFFPDTRALSIWVFLPMELVTMGLILLFGAAIARASRHQEMSALKQARQTLRTRVAELRATVGDPLQAAAALKGSTRLRQEEDVLVREAVVEEYLAAEPDALVRLQGMVSLVV
jgi:hypothetical protein